MSFSLPATTARYRPQQRAAYAADACQNIVQGLFEATRTQGLTWWATAKGVDAHSKAVKNVKIHPPVVRLAPRCSMPSSGRGWREVVAATVPS